MSERLMLYMQKQKKEIVKMIFTRAGSILTGLLGIILFGGDKVASGSLLMITAVVLALPIRQNKALRLARAGFVCLVIAVVIWNISTTQVPGDPGVFMVQGYSPSPDGIAYRTGFRFLDQLVYIFEGFLQGRVFQGR